MLSNPIFWEPGDFLGKGFKVFFGGPTRKRFDKKMYFFLFILYNNNLPYVRKNGEVYSPFGTCLLFFRLRLNKIVKFLHTFRLLRRSKFNEI